MHLHAKAIVNTLSQSLKIHHILLSDEMLQVPAEHAPNFESERLQCLYTTLYVLTESISLLATFSFSCSLHYIYRFLEVNHFQAQNILACFTARKSLVPLRSPSILDTFSHSQFALFLWPVLLVYLTYYNSGEYLIIEAEYNCYRSYSSSYYRLQRARSSSENVGDEFCTVS